MSRFFSHAASCGTMKGGKPFFPENHMGLHIAASGILSALERQRVSAHNIANLRTPGFRASRAESQPAPGGGVRTGSITPDNRPGPLEYTGRPLDVAASGGNAFFQVELANGEAAYTRSGDFTLNANGEVVTTTGARVSPPIQAPANAASVSVTRSGAVYATVPGALEPRQVGQLEVFQFANPEGLASAGGGLLRATPASGEAQPAAGPLRLESGALMQSNVDLARESTGMLMNRQLLQANVNAFRAQDAMLGALLDLEG
jgi:flagellar basal-body rod protein FlgG